jgi:hypothetical protein
LGPTHNSYSDTAEQIAVPDKKKKRLLSRVFHVVEHPFWVLARWGSEDFVASKPQPGQWNR